MLLIYNRVWQKKVYNRFVSLTGPATAAAKQIVREAGFGYACTSLQDVVRPESDMYELTRFWQKDLDADRFARGLKSWLSR